MHIGFTQGLPGVSDSEEPACFAGNPGSLPGEGNSNPFQSSCLENSMDRGAWRATVHGVKESNRTERLTLSLFTQGSHKLFRKEVKLGPNLEASSWKQSEVTFYFSHKYSLAYKSSSE